MDGLESVEDNVLKMSEINFEPNPNGIGCELFHCMKRNESLLAQIDTYTDEHDNYDELLQRCVRTAIHLKERHIKPNNIICICSYNHLNSCVPYLAGLFIGARVCCLDPHLSFSETGQLLLQIKPHIIFVVTEKKEMYKELLRTAAFETELIVFGKEGSKSFQEFLEECSDEMHFAPEKANNVDDTAVIVFSSGTTGLAKGICLSHYVLHAKGEILSSFFNVQRSFLSASLHWIYGVAMLINGIFAGAARILARSFTVFDTWRNIAQFKVSLAFVTSSLAVAMVKGGKPDYLEPNSFKYLENLLISGNIMPTKHLLALREILPNVNVCQIYGQTEVGGLAMLFRPRLEKDAISLQNKPKSCGRPLPGFWYKIVSLDTEKSLGCNQIGELRLKTDIQLSGYHGLPSSKIWDSNGWLQTGDICYYDEEYCFYVVDQIKEIVHFQSWNLFPSVLESILLEHSAVSEVAVIGLPNDEDGERPLAVVILADKEKSVTAEMLVEYVNNQVDEKQKLRGGVMFVDHVPFTPTGRIRKTLLKETVLK